MNISIPSLATASSQASEEKRRQATMLFNRHAELLATEGAAMYGYEPDSVFFKSSLHAISDPTVQNFRLDEFPALINDPSFFSTPKSILDLGCGTGPYVHEALRRGQNAFGVDLDPQKIWLARLKADMYGVRSDLRSRVIVGDAGALPYEAQSFDLVTSYTALEHMPDIPAVLYESVRVTRVGGFIECLAPDYRGPYDTHYGMAWPSMMPRRQAERWCLAMDRPSAGIGSFFPITLPQIQSCLEALGCETVHASLTMHTPYEKIAFDGNFAQSPMLANDQEIESFAQSIRDAEKAGTLDVRYRAALVFALVVRRVR